MRNTFLDGNYCHERNSVITCSNTFSVKISWSLEISTTFPSICLQHRNKIWNCKIQNNGDLTEQFSRFGRHQFIGTNKILYMTSGKFGPHSVAKNIYVTIIWQVVLHGYLRGNNYYRQLTTLLSGQNDCNYDGCLICL